MMELSRFTHSASGKIVVKSLAGQTVPTANPIRAGGQRITAGIRCWTTLLREQSQKYENSTLRLANKTNLVPSGSENPAHLSPDSNSGEDCRVQAARRS
jgi:hypothetical protein